MVKENGILIETLTAQRLLESAIHQRVKSKIKDHYLLKSITETLVLRELIYENAPIHKFRDLAVKYGYKEIRLDGITKALDGIVTLDDVVNVTRSFKKCKVL
jgi:type II secretory ATPase GspE/PulE/Tfp pilus assembly ATPase PilB-like protein